MNKTFVVARWEYLQKVKTKTFIISLFVTPLIILLFTAGPALLMDDEEDLTKPIGLADSSGMYFNAFNESLSEYAGNTGQPRYIVINLAVKGHDKKDIIYHSDRQVLNGSLMGYLAVFNGGTDSVVIQFRSAVLISPEDLHRIEKSFNEARLKTSTELKSIPSDRLHKIFSSIDISAVIIEEAGRESEADFLTKFFSSLVLIMLLLMIIISIGGMLIRSILEEKSNRLIEILLSSCTPRQLLSGKIIGLSALGFTQIIVWALLGFIFSGTHLINPDVFNNILPMLLFFILGFIFYTSVYVGVGSVVTTEQEAQQINGYLSILLFLPIVFALPAIQNPDSTFVQVFSFIPFTSPAIMLFRFNAGPVPLWETIAITIVMIIAIMLTVTVTSKIFRIGILSYGKKPSLREVFQWLNNN